MEIGFMQGRLCDMVDGKIQAFPWGDWQTEFPAAQSLGLAIMEWTLDHEFLYENPLMTVSGQTRIRELSARHGVKVVSLTGDCFMQVPFYKVSGAEREGLLADLRAVLDACQKVGVRYVLVPLVDNGSLRTSEQEAALISGVSSLQQWLVDAGMKIIFESDFEPKRLAAFIDRLPSDAFGINYDIGNSAALGFSAIEEISIYGRRIENVHVKDREYGGFTVPLGDGNADFAATFGALRKVGYDRNFILQTARAPDNDHLGAIARYRDMTKAWWTLSGS
jgi:L-ribulose-5-phosphate 3-epimerase